MNTQCHIQKMYHRNCTPETYIILLKCRPNKVSIFFKKELHVFLSLVPRQQSTVSPPHPRVLHPQSQPPTDQKTKHIPHSSTRQNRGLPPQHHPEPTRARCRRVLLQPSALPQTLGLSPGLTRALFTSCLVHRPFYVRNPTDFGIREGSWKPRDN